MPPLMMAGYEVQHRPSRAAREAVRGTAHPLSLRVSTGQIRSWDLFSLVATGAPDLAEWADKTLTSLASSAAERFAEPLTEGCIECEDIGFYGLVSSADPDML